MVQMPPSRRKMTANKQSIDNFPFISIIIPVLNGEKHIQLCLDSLFRILYPKEKYEVIVVDNGSTDDTLTIAKNYGVKIFQIPDVTIAALRNCGAFNAKGGILAFVDSDCVVDEKWLNNAVECFRLSADNEIGMVGSLVRCPQNCNWVGKAWDICYEKRSLKGMTDRLGAANMLIKREHFERIQGFNENLVTGEDDDLCFRLRKSGYKIYSDPSITVYHLGENKSLFEFFSKEVWRGYESFRLFVKNKGKMNFKITAYALLNLFLIIGIMISLTIFVFYEKGYMAIITFVALILVLPIFLAIKAVIYSKKWKYIFPFFVLYLTLGIARACAVLRFK